MPVIHAVLNFHGMIKVVPYEDYMSIGFAAPLKLGVRMVPISPNHPDAPSSMNQIRYTLVGRSSNVSNTMG